MKRVVCCVGTPQTTKRLKDDDLKNVQKDEHKANENHNQEVVQQSTNQFLEDISSEDEGEMINAALVRVDVDDGVGEVDMNSFADFIDRYVG